MKDNKEAMEDRIRLLEDGIISFIDWLKEKRAEATGMGAPINILTGLINDVPFKPTPSPNSVEDMAKEYALKWVPDEQNDDWLDKKQKNSQRIEIGEHFENGYKAGFLAASNKESEGDAVEFAEWLGSNYDFNEFNNRWGKYWEEDGNDGFNETPITELYQLFINSKEHG